MELSEVVQNIIYDTAKDLNQEFDRNFERRAFFDQKWKETKNANSRGSLMQRSNKLRKSINTKKGKGSISWTSAMPYASIHNEGGEIEVTAAMKKFFWAMFYKVSGASSGGGKQRQEKLSAEAAKWKAMALMKVGTKMKIEQRQFIGWHPRVNESIEEITAHEMKLFNEHLAKQLKPK